MTTEKPKLILFNGRWHVVSHYQYTSKDGWIDTETGTYVCAVGDEDRLADLPPTEDPPMPSVSNMSKLEPGSNHHVPLSQAISLKRIADALERIERKS